MKILRYLSLVVLALAFVVASAVPASATTITVQSIVIPNYRVALNPGETLYLVIYADRPFISSAGIPIQAGSPANGRWYKRVTCSVVGTDVTIPSFTLDSTTDAQDIPGKAARYSAYFYANTRNLGQYGGFESFRLLPVYTNPTPTDATWAQIRADNTTGAVMSIDRTTLTSEQINRLVNDLIATSGGVTTIEGQAGPTITITDDTNVTITGSGNVLTVGWAGTLAVARGGSGSGTASGARTNLGAAASGANSDITSLSALSTPLSGAQGGTGIGSYTVGDLLYASGASTLSKLAGVATGQVLVSGGVATAPAWSASPTLTALTTTNSTTTNLTVTGLTTGRVPYVGAADAILDDSNFLWDATNDRLSIGTTDSTYAINLANASYLSGRGSVSGAQVRAIGIAAGQQVQSATGSGLSIVDTPVSVDTVNLGLGGTAIQHVYTEGGASALNPFRPLYEVGTNGIHVHAGFAGSYNDSARSGNWHLASIVRNLGTTPTVALYGEAIGAGAGADMFAGNLTAVATVNNVGLTGMEIGLVALDDGVTALTGVSGTGLSLFANSDGLGPYNFSRAIYVGSNTSVANWNYGLEFASTNTPITTALIFGGISNSAVLGIDLSGFNASSDQALKLYNNDGIVSNDQTGTYAVDLAKMTATQFLVYGDASASKNIAGTIIYSGAGAESVRIDTSRRLGLNMPASLTHQFGVRPLTTRGLADDGVGPPVVATLAGLPTVTGTNTVFTTDLRPGNTLVINSVAYKILDIASNTSLTLTTNAASNLVGQTATTDTAMLEIENAAGDHTFAEVDAKGTLVLYDDGATDAALSSAAYTDTDGALRIQNRRSANGRFVFGYDHDTSNAYISNRTGTAATAGWGNIILNAGGTTGYVGIGTAAPIALLTVEGSGVKTADFVSSFFSNTATSVTGGVSKLSALYSATGSWLGTTIGARFDVSGGIDANDNKTTYAALFRGGRVGIGTSSLSVPLAMLYVTGTPDDNVTEGALVTSTWTNGDATVTGAGTTFTSLFPGQVINDGTTSYQIDYVDSTTSLELTATYGGATSAFETTYVDPDLFTIANSVGTAYFKQQGGITNILGTLQLNRGATIASATTINVNRSAGDLLGNIFHISGTTTVETITGGIDGMVIVLVFDSTANVSEAGNILVAGAGPFVPTANSTLTLYYDSGLTKWVQIGSMTN